MLSGRIAFVPPSPRSNASGRTVRQVQRSSDGTVRAILVASADGARTISLRPNAVSVSGDVVTTTQALPPRD